MRAGTLIPLRRTTCLVTAVMLAVSGLQLTTAQTAFAARTGHTPSRHRGATRSARHQAKRRKGGLKHTKHATHQRSTSDRYTPVSHAVSKGGKTNVQYYAAPTFRQTSRGWKRLNGQVRHQRGAFSLTAPYTAVPTSFGRRHNALVRFRTTHGPVTWGLSGARNVRPHLVRMGRQRVVVYRRIKRGLNLVYGLSGSQLRESLVIRSRKAPRTFAFRIRDPHHVLGAVKRGKYGEVNFTGWVGNGLKMSLAAPSAASGASLRAGQPGDGSATQSVQRIKTGYLVRLSLNSSWAAKHSFPVVLDPSLSYSWDDATLDSSFAPSGSTACDGDPCPLASEEDGSTFIAQGSNLGPIQALFHVNLSQIPQWEHIDSAAFNFELDPDASFDFCADWSLKGKYANAGPSDSLSTAITGTTQSSTGDLDDEGTAGDGGDLLSWDITDITNEWIQSDHSDQASLLMGVRSSCLRTALPTGITTAYNYGWIEDPSVTIEYTGALLPPPIPDKQSHGCSCGWNHGADRAKFDADPVNTAVGDAMETHTDLSTPGAGVPFAFQRTYNSADDRDGPLGVGWSIDYGAMLSENGTTGDVTFRDPTGGEMVFSPQVGGGYEGATGVTSELEALSGGGWTLASTNGEVLTFNADGEETADDDAAGDGLTFAYTGSGASRHLHTVTDVESRTTTLAWGSTGAANGKLVSVTTSDGREVDYGYSTIDSAAHLTSVTDADGNETTLSYNSTSGLLEGVTSPESNTSVQNTYDSHGRITSQTDANSNTWTFAWVPAGGSNASSYPSDSGTETVTDPNGNVTRDQYYGNVLLKHIDAYGNPTSYTYDNELNITSITDARGYVTTMTYDTAGNMLTRTAPDPLNYEEEWTYDTANNVTSYTNGRGKTWDYTYNSRNLPLTVTDPLTHVTTMTYTSDGQLATKTTPEGRETSYDYDTHGNRTSQTDGEGDQTTWSYDNAGRMTSKVDPRGNASGATPADYTTDYTYDDAGRLLTSTAPDGTLTTNSYNDDGNLTEKAVTHGTGGNLSDTTYTYDGNGNLLTRKDFSRTVETDTYDPDNNKISSTDAAGNEITYTYDPNSQVASKVDPNGNESGASPCDFSTYYYYDEVGNLVETDRPASRSDATSYDALNRPTSTFDSDYHETDLTYDAANNKTSSTDPLGKVTTWSYDDDKRLTGHSLPGQDPTTFVYDNDGHRLSSTTPSGNSETTWTYDDADRVVTKTDPRGNESGATAANFTTHYGYDQAGNRTSLTDELGNETTWTYDAEDNQTSTTDPRSNTTSWSYDHLHRITEVNPPGTGTVSTTYGYNDYGDLTSRTNGRGKTTTYAYNDVDELTSVTDPLGREKTYGYDANGNLTSYVTARGNASGATAADYTVTQTFDGANRVTERTTPGDTADADYSYNGEDQITGLTDLTGTSSFGYDDDGRLTSVEQPTGNYSYVYNDASQIESRTYPSGEEIDYTYNDDGRTSAESTIVGLSTETTHFEYNADQDLNSIDYPSSVGVTETRSYDRDGRISQVKSQADGASTPISQYDYTRDEAGNPTEIERTRGTTTLDESYVYNDRDWLTMHCTAATSCGSAANYVSYTYDNDGNRTQQNIAGTVPGPGGASATDGTTTYTYDDADELTSSTTTPVGGSGTTSTYAYDDDGNLTSDGRTWNVLNQLTTSNINGVAATYSYDGLANRTSVSTDDGITPATRAFSWDVNNPLPMLAVITNANSTTTSQAYAVDGTLLSSEHPGASYARDYYLHAELGTVAGEVAGDGTVENLYDYDPWGTRTDTAAGAGEDNGFGFAGAYLEAASGDYDLRARNYDPAIGRFESIDPLQIRPSDFDSSLPETSPYPYASDMPTTHVDPSGQMDEPDVPPEDNLPTAGGVDDADPLQRGQPIGEDEAEQAGEEWLEQVEEEEAEYETAAKEAVNDVQNGAEECAEVVEKAIDGIEADELEQAAQKVPEEWGEGRPNRNLGGTRWVDPLDEGNRIRIDHAVPESPFPSQRVDHVIVHYDGRIVGPDGKWITGSLKENFEAHIPLTDWLKWSLWYRP